MRTSKLSQMQSVLLKTPNIRRFKLTLKSPSHHASALSIMLVKRGLLACWQVAHWKSWLCTQQAVISRRYLITIPNRAAQMYLWWALNTVDLTLICKRGPFVNCRHNKTARCNCRAAKQVSAEVSTEPPLMPDTGESLPREKTLEPGARREILAGGFYSWAFFDVRVSHPGAPTNSVYETPAEMYASREKQKITKYNHRVIQIEKGTFAPLCILKSGGMGPQAKLCLSKSWQTTWQELIA